MDVPNGQRLPGKVEKLYAYPMDLRSIFVEWQPPADLNGRLLAYEIKLVEQEGPYVSPGPSIYGPTILHDIRQPYVKVTNLRVGHYWVFVTAVTSNGRGEEATVKASTQFDQSWSNVQVPSPPTIAVTGITDSFVIVDWLLQGAMCSPQQYCGEGFYVRYKPVSGLEWSASPEEKCHLSIQLSHLMLETQYEIQGVAVSGPYEVEGPKVRFTTGHGYTGKHLDCSTCTCTSSLER